MTVLNAIMAQTLTAFKEEVDELIEKGEKKEIAIMHVLQRYVSESKKVLFEVGSAHPVQDTKEVLVQIAKEIGKISNRALIAGHTDRRPYSDDRHYSNWELSSDRANGARRVLVENGMKPEQIARVVGFADTQLLNEKDPYADANRRITILVLPLNEGRKSSALVGGPPEKKPSPIIPETQHEGDPETPKKEAASSRKSSH